MIVKVIVLVLTISTIYAGAFNQKLELSEYVPIVLGKENIINFAITNGQAGETVNADASGYSFNFSSLPDWIDLVNGAMIAGVPKQAGSSNIKVSYTDKKGNSYNKNLVLADNTTSAGRSNNFNNLNNARTASFATQNSQSAGYISYARSNLNTQQTGTSGSTPQMTTVLLPPSQGNSISLNGNPTLVTLQAPPQFSSVNYVSTNPNSYSQDRIQATVVSQQTAQNNYLNTILALSQARQTLDNLNNSASNVNKQLKSASDYLQNTQTQHSQALVQQQVSVQKINQANGAINDLGNLISSDQQKLNNLNDLIAQIQAQLVQAGAMKQNAQSNTSAASISVAQAKQQVQTAIKAINDANTQINVIQKRIGQAQNTITISSTSLYLAESALNSSNYRLKAAEAELAAAKATQSECQFIYDNLTKAYKQAPFVIQNSTNQITQLKAEISGKLAQNLETAKNNLALVSLNKTNVNQYVGLVANAQATLIQQLAIAQQASANVSLSIKNSQALLTNANNALNQLLSNKAIADSNVFTLKSQLGIAQQTFNKAQYSSTSLQSQISQATNAYKIAVTSFSVAAATKQASDNQLQQLLSVGLNYPYPIAGVK